MNRIEINKATDPLADYVEAARKVPLVVTRRGKPLVAIVSVDQTDMECLSLGTNPDFLALIERSRAQIAKGQGVSSDEVRRRLSLPQKRKTAKRKTERNGSRTRRAS
ncbi:MAG: type II toxin-antitoxin system prevent-host-death family antitoxin [Pirellulales bacterium]